MAASLSAERVMSCGLAAEEAARVVASAEAALRRDDPQERWREVAGSVLRPEHPHALHRYLHDLCFVDWDVPSRGPAPAWMPGPEATATNLAHAMRERGTESYEAFHRFSAERRGEFWEMVLRRLAIVFHARPSSVCDASSPVEAPRWLPGARLNVVESCFPEGGDDAPAILWQAESGSMERVTRGALKREVDRAARGFERAGFGPGDAIAIDMPMTVPSVIAYLGLVKAGMVAVSIADSFAPEEIATRLRLAGAKGIVTQDVIVRGGKTLPMYAKVVEAGAPRAVVVPAGPDLAATLRGGDVAWADFLGAETPYPAVARDPDDVTNILFSSGTTGDPKAIPWTQLTPIKAAADGHFHHDIRAGDVVAWPTNLGWMMGPWLIYASLLNRACMALYGGAPTGAGFARFVEAAEVTMLGLVPSLVKTWRETGCLAGVDWSRLRAFSSTGECSNADDYFWLMGRARGYRPVIEYCGGTEIGGGYITGTVVQPQAPACFSTPALGLDFLVIDEAGKATDNGEVALVPPSIGLSASLLNADHHRVYYQDMPRGPRGEVLRRHGDQIERLAGGYFRAHGRVDDTMNLGGIKVSSAEIERVLDTVSGVKESAAIAVPPPGGGPSLLVLFIVRAAGDATPVATLQPALQKAIREHLNPLFKIHRVEVVPSLPRTASNKVMRRTLRSQLAPG